MVSRGSALILIFQFVRLDLYPLYSIEAKVNLSVRNYSSFETEGLDVNQLKMPSVVGFGRGVKSNTTS